MIERLGIKASDGDEDRKREKSERKRISGCIIHFIHRECVEHSLGYRSLSLTLCLALTHTHTHTDWKNSLGTQTPDKTLKVYTNASPHPFQTHRPTQSPTHSCVHLVKQWAGTNSKYLCRQIFFFFHYEICHTSLFIFCQMGQVTWRMPNESFVPLFVSLTCIILIVLSVLLVCHL